MFLLEQLFWNILLRFGTPQMERNIQNKFSQHIYDLHNFSTQSLVTYMLPSIYRYAGSMLLEPQLMQLRYCKTSECGIKYLHCKKDSQADSCSRPVHISSTMPSETLHFYSTKSMSYNHCTIALMQLINRHQVEVKRNL